MRMKFARGKNCRVFSDNIFDHEWKETGETTIHKEPMRNTKVEVTWYLVEDGGEQRRFGFAVIGPDYYMFLVE